MVVQLTSDNSSLQRYLEMETNDQKLGNKMLHIWCLHVYYYLNSVLFDQYYYGEQVENGTIFFNKTEDNRSAENKSLFWGMF